MKKLKAQYIKTMTQGIPDDLSDLKDVVAAFIIYEDPRSWGVNWSDENINFLSEVGLPESAPTMINFCRPSAQIDNYIHIGFNNYGDCIVVEIESGNIGYINHDFNNRFEYMNRDAISLFKTIVAFAEFIREQTPFDSKIRSIDAEAFENNNWWFREYHGWKNK